MATVTSTVTASPSSHTISRGYSSSSTLSWSLPSVPSGTTITSCVLTGTLTVSMSKGGANVTINGTTYTATTSLSINLGTSNTTSSLSATVKGSGNSNGTVSFSNLVYTVTYEEAAIEPPVITIISQDRTKISSISGYDRCTVTFTADQVLTYWEARATTTQTPGHGVGLLVESGELALGETGYIYVDDEELTNGDADYKICIYGQNSSGVWSDD